MAEPTLVPKKLPDEKHAVIVVLATVHLAMPAVDTSPLTHEVLPYKHTAAGEAAERIKNASVVVTTSTPLTQEVMQDAPYLKAILCHTVGVDHIDLEACRARGIRVYNSPGCAAETVAEHALALYFATRRNLIPLYGAVMDFDEGRPNGWKARGNLIPMMQDGNRGSPKTLSQEVVGLMGHGNIGKRIASMCRALGMKVLISGRKDASTATSEPSAERTPFAEVLKQATVVMLSLPLEPSTANLLGAAELAAMRAEAVVVNISRGGLVDEEALVEALVAKKIWGYGSDVFATEPASSAEDSVLLGERARGLNLALTPHLAWISDTTKGNVRDMVTVNVRNWVEGSEENRVV